MATIRKSDLRLLAQLSQLALCNPFSPERFQLEEQVLGKRFQPEEMVAWNHHHTEPANERPNVTLLAEAARSVIQRVQQAANDGKTVPQESFGHYWNVATYALLYRHIVPLPMNSLTQPSTITKTWKAFETDYRTLTNLPGLTESQTQSAPQLFALLWQIHRAFYNIFVFILGDSLPSAQLTSRRLAIDLHLRLGTISQWLVCSHEHIANPDHRPVRHRQGTGRTSDRAFSVHRIRRRQKTIRRVRHLWIPTAEPICHVGQLDRVRTFRPSQGLVHRRGLRSAGLVRTLPGIGCCVSSTRSVNCKCHCR